MGPFLPGPGPLAPTPPQGVRGPTVYYQSVAGAVSFAGSDPVFAMSRAVTGALSFTGAAPLFAMSRLLVGAGFTPTGVLVRSASRILTGVFRPTGVVSRLVSRSVTGALSFTGSGLVSKATARRVTGAFTPTGVLAARRSFLRTVTAVLTFSGSLAHARATMLALAQAALTFIGGTNLFPAPALYPSPDIYPYGGAILVQVNRALAGVMQAAGSLSEIPPAHAFARTFNGVLQPHVVFFKVSARVFLAAQFSSAALFGVRASHTVGQALFASLRAAGSFHSMLNPGYRPPGGGGFGVPMPDAFFLRYKPTLRRQKVKV